jgi:branched-chain amino acid transport system substrate-binding protein
MTQRRLLSAAAIALALVTSACGSSTGTASTSASGGSSPGKTLNFAFFTEITGPTAASLAPSADGAQAAVQAINDAGGVDGYRLHLKVYDTQSTPAGAVAAVRSAIAGHVFGAISVSIDIDGALPLIKQAGFPLTGFGVSPAWYADSNTNMFSFAGKIAPTISYAWPDFFLDQGKKKLAVVSDAGPGGPQGGERFAQLIKARGGQVVYTNYDLQATDVAAITSIAQQIKQSGAQGVLGAAPIGLANLQAALNQIGANIDVLQGGQYGSAVAQQFGSAADGLTAALFFTALEATSSKGVSDYVAGMKAAGAEGSTYNLWAADAWISTQLMAEGIRTAATAGHPLTSQSLINALNHVNGWTLNGFIPPVHFPAFRTAQDGCLSFTQLTDGKWAAVDDGAFKCASVPGT